MPPGMVMEIEMGDRCSPKHWIIHHPIDCQLHFGTFSDDVEALSSDLLADF